MASVTNRPGYRHDETQRRVRHPLDVVRKYIRTYVVLEGAALALLFLAAWFWIGLVLDWGVFKLFAFDWIQELRDVTPGARNDLWLRLVILVALGLGLLALLLFKVGLRWVREFNDRAVALVLERRFPRELGDRLITAVEIADPARAEKYGFSRAMIEKTCNDAAERVEKLPVSEVFNWHRLRGLWLLVAAATVGVYVLVGLVSCALAGALGENPSPVAFAWRFHDTATTWTERNALLLDSYWPRRAYLEMVRFPHTKNDPLEMRLGESAQPPALVVRAYQWVIADRAAPGGWRPLRWADLREHDLVPDEVLAEAEAAVPPDWPHWLVDLDELSPEVAVVAEAGSRPGAEAPVGLVPVSWQGKASGEVRRRAAAARLGASDRAAIESMLDWHTWSIDRLYQQKETPQVRQSLRTEPPGAWDRLENVFAHLQEQADAPSMARRLRKLEVPETVLATFRGEKTKKETPGSEPVAGKFTIPLTSLSESLTFRIRAADYYTPTHRITLVPPPRFAELLMDRAEPAYLHYRLLGDDQSPLKGKKQLIVGERLSTDGDANAIEVPLGSSLKLRARTDRVLREPGVGGAPVRVKAPEVFDKGVIVPDSDAVTLDADRKGFALGFAKVERPIEFAFEFFDEDNVRGQRRIKIVPRADERPRVEKVELLVGLRKPRFKAAGKTAGPAAPGTPTDAYLITPEALLPFGGALSDDVMLVRAGWSYSIEPIDVELIGSGGGKGSLPTLVLNGTERQIRTNLALTAWQLLPGSTQPLAGPAYLAWLERVLKSDLVKARAKLPEVFVPMEEFERVLAGRSLTDVPLNKLAELLAGGQAPPRRPRWEHQLKDEAPFNVSRLKLKPEELSAPQPHYIVRLAVVATDNDVETGPPYTDIKGHVAHGQTSRSKTQFKFLVVSENELLTQIGLEEELLYEKLERASDKVKNALTATEDQARKAAAGVDANPVVLRMNEVRKAVQDASALGREVQSAYGNILKEMEVNRVAKDRRDKIQNKIFYPLDDVTRQPDGSFAKTEDAVHKALGALEDAAAANKAAGPADVANLRETEKHLTRLNDELNSILIAMGDNLSEAKALELLVSMEQRQRKIRDKARMVEKKITEDLLEGVLNPGGSKKQPEKKQSLRSIEPPAVPAGVRQRDGRAELRSVVPNGKETGIWLRPRVSVVIMASALKG